MNIRWSRILRTLSEKKIILLKWRKNAISRWTLIHKKDCQEIEFLILRPTLMHKKDCQEIEFLILRPTAVSFFPFQAGVFLVLDSSSWVICKYITLLFPVPLSPIYPISISEWQNLNDKANSIALYRKLILVSLRAYVLGHTRKRKVILAVSSAL